MLNKSIEVERGGREEAAKLRDESILLHGRLSESKLSFAAVEAELEQVGNSAILWYKYERKFHNFVPAKCGENFTIFRPIYDDLVYASTVLTTVVEGADLLSATKPTTPHP
jgi:hypothetical protein